MPRSYPRFKAAACHAAPVFLDAGKTGEKACALIREAANAGARLIAFPESFIPGFPLWAALEAPYRSHDLFAAFAAQSLRRDGPEIAAVRAAARRSGVIVSLGFSEASETSAGCLWNANLLIGSGGEILVHHRKLVPTFYEKLIWANGDGRGLRCALTELGRLGMLICGENTNPLARFALMADGEEVHISSYPAVWPTRPAGEEGGYDLRRAIEIRAGAHAFEAKAFTLVASAAIDDSLYQALRGLDRAARETIEASPRAASMILDPSGKVISEVLSEEEGIVYAEIDLSRAVEPKRFHDVAGSYNRFDIFRLEIDRRPREPAVFRDAPWAESPAKIPPEGGAGATEET